MSAAAATAPSRGASVLSPAAWFRRWLQSRLPPTDTWVLGQRNVYILPTRAGFTFALTLVVMLLASINYQLNLGHALTFLLAGAGVVSMHLTHANLRGLTLHLRPPQPVFAGEAALLEVVITNPGRERFGLTLRLQDPPAEAAATATATAGGEGAAAPAPGASRNAAIEGVDAPAGGQSVAHVSIVPAHRGWHAAPVLVLETIFPLGLFRAWTVWRPAQRVLAWPRPELPPPPLPQQAGSPGDAAEARRGSGSELDGVRPWKRGDTMRQVVWKKVARSGELVSRETAGSAQRELWLDWADTAGVGGGAREQRLSRLASWVLQAEREGIDNGLRLPGRELPPAQGDAHKRAALDALATW